MNNIQNLSAAHIYGNATDAGNNLKQAAETAEKFEGYIMAHCLKEMHSEIKPDPMFGGGTGEEIFKSFLLDEFGEIIAQKSSIGIKDKVSQSLIHLQEGE